MAFLAFVWDLLSKVRLILGSETIESKRDVLSTYLKLRAKHASFVELLRLSIPNERLFGFKANLLDYASFIYMFEEIFISNVYHFHAKVRRPVIIDCGANIGMALMFFKKLYPSSKIIAFEPDKRAFEILKDNMEMNNIQDVELVNKAVHDSQGIINLYYDQHHPGSLTMSTRKPRLPREYQAVDSVLLSDYIEGPVDFLKLDIEGAEDVVIEELSRRNRLTLVSEMVIEYHHHMEPERDNLSTVLRMLEESGFGYQISARSRNPLRKEMFQDILVYAYNKRGPAPPRPQA